MLHKIGYNFGLDGMPMTMYRGICPNSPNQADHLLHASLDKKARPQIGLPVTCLTRGRSLTGSARLIPLISDKTKPTFDHSSRQLRTGKNVIPQEQDKTLFPQIRTKCHFPIRTKCHFPKSGQNVIFPKSGKMLFLKIRTKCYFPIRVEMSFPKIRYKSEPNTSPNTDGSSGIDDSKAMTC